MGWPVGCLVGRSIRPSGRFRSWAIAISGGVLAIIIATPVASLDFSSLSLVYAEDYQGESVYLTTPELDAMSAGGMDGEGETPLGGSPKPGPVLTGTAARASLTTTAPGAAGFHAMLLRNGTNFGPGPVGFRSRGSVDTFDLTPPVGSVSATFFVYASFDTPSVASATVWGAVTLAHDSGTTTAALTLFEGDGGGGIVPIGAVALPTAEAAALLVGAPFELDLIVDRDTLAATTSVEITGFPEHSAGPSTITVATPADPLYGGAQGLLATGFIPPLTEIDFTALEIYRFPRPPFSVDTTADEVDLSPGDRLCQGASGFCSLRAAIEETNALPGPDAITVPGGTYLLTIGGTGEKFAASGDLNIRDDLVIQGADRNTTIIDGGLLDRVFEVPTTTAGVRAELLDLQVVGGAATAADGFQGGGLANEGELILRRCIVSGNTANVGGGIANFGDLTVEDCVVENNSALALGFVTPTGSGIANGAPAPIPPTGTAMIRDSAVVDNISPSAAGLSSGNAISITIENSTVSGNAGTQVGLSDVDAILEHVTIVSTGIGLRPRSTSGTHTLDLANNAIEGSAACSFAPSAPVVTTYSGQNASSDTSCGFVALGDVAGVALDLSGLISAADSRSHSPLAGSPLIDAADTLFCPPADQIGTLRPLDGDNDGTPDCDLGAIEVPEPGFGLELVSGLFGLIAARQRRRMVRPTVENRLEC
ncbi:MAG: hypothetical protein CL908_01860 [Deltaproteobacteria bacterium]|nr:hypothetical protein [Deltaproteobacteria bacterium]